MDKMPLLWTNGRVWAATACLLVTAGCSDQVPTSPTDQPQRIQASVSATPGGVIRIDPSGKNVRATSRAVLRDSAAIRLVTNSGSRTKWTATAKKAWTKITAASGTGEGFIHWERTTAGLRDGVYVDTIAAKASGSTLSLLIDTLVIATGAKADALLSIAPTHAFTTAVRGSTVKQPATAAVTLGGAAAWTATNKRTWNALLKSSGTGDAAVEWMRDPSGLVEGLHIDTITVSSPGSPAALLIDTLRILPRPPTGGDMTAGSAESPTGRRPKLIWTPRRQFVWNRMRAENHPWWKLVESYANRSGSGRDVYDDRGQWAMLAYQITGDVRYARKAWAKIRDQLASTGANHVRQHFAQSVLVYDWLYPALTVAERAEFIAALNRWGRFVLGEGTAAYVGGFRLADSDATVGYYFGLAFLDLATGPDNPTAGTWLSRTARGGVAIGGLTATGEDRRTARNALAQYARLAEGGEWIESAQYNPNTATLLLVGAEGVRTATGTDWFPEVARLAKQMAVAYSYLVSPDLKSAVQWGDEESPREFDKRLFRHTMLLGTVAGLTLGTTEGQVAQGTLRSLTDRYGFTGYGSAQPLAQALYFVDPYAPSRDWRALPATHLASGVGLFKVKHGNELFVAHSANRLNVDHGTDAMGTFQLYRNGEWVVTHPLGYGGDAVTAIGANSIALAGLSAMATRRILASDGGANWGSITMRTGGSLYDPGYYSAPPAFLDSWTRSLAYFTEGSSSVIVVWDSVVANDPRKLGGIHRYRAPDRRRIGDAGDVIQWIIHTPVRPTLAASSLNWSTPGGQRVTVHTLSPAAQKRRVIDEKALWIGTANFLEREKKFQVRISPETHARTTVLLNVIVVGSESLRPMMTPSGLSVGSTRLVFGPTGMTVSR